MKPAKIPKLAPFRVMIVEDDIMMRAVTSDSLRSAGFEVIEASNGDEAWSYLLADTAVDVIFSDVHMPGSLNGSDLAGTVKRRFPNIPVLLTSGQGATVRTGDIDFVPKPYRMENVISTIMELVKTQRVI